MTQTARAFGSVNDALTFVVTYYVYLADYKSVLDRLTSFDQSIEKADAYELRPQPAPKSRLAPTMSASPK